MIEATHDVIARHKKEIETAAVGLFLTLQEMGPMFHVIDGDNHSHLIQPREWNSDNRDHTVEWVRRFARERNAIMVASIAEAWFSTLPKDTTWTDTSPMPSEDPNRKECLIIAFDSILGSDTVMYEIDRSEAKAKLINRTEATSQGGRFSNIVGRKVN